MKRVILVIETPGNIRVIGYDYDKIEPLDYTIDLQNTTNLKQTIKQLINELHSQGYDTRILRRYFKKKFGERKRGGSRHG